MCEAEKTTANCDQWFQRHPEAQSKERKCDVQASCPMPVQIADYVKACGVGVLGAAGDFFVGIYDFVAGDVKIPPEIKSRETYFKKCYSASCKYKMLGQYADLFSKAEIQGYTNTRDRKPGDPGYVKCRPQKNPADTQCLDPADPANGNYLNGLSSKVLYNKLLEKLKKRAQGKSTTDEFIEPWSDKKAKTRQSIDDLMKGVLAQAGLHNTACYDPAVVAEAQCYAVGAVLDPIAGAAAILKIRKLAGLRALDTEMKSAGEYGNVPDKPKKSLMKAAERIDAKDRQYVRPSTIRIDELKRETQAIWDNDKLSSDQKLKQVFDKYAEMRIASLDAETQDIARKALSDVQVNASPGNASWNYAEQKLSLGKFITENELAGYQTLAHEFEHLTQFPTTKNANKVQMEAMQEMLDKNLAYPNGPVSLHHSEFEAVASQWDFLQAVPVQVRENAIAAISKSTTLPADTKKMLLEDIKNASLTREEYVKAVPFQHKYSSYYELRNEAFGRQVRLGVVIMMAGTAGGMGTGIYHLIKSDDDK